MKRIIGLLLIIILVSSIIVGCVQKDNSNDGGNTTQAGSTTSSEVDTRFWATHKPLTLTIHYHNWEKAFNDDWVVFKEAAKLTNVTLKGTIPETATDPQQEFNIMIASGELADIVYGLNTDINKYIDSGVFLPLDDLIDEYAPNIKRFFEENPSMYEKAKAPDGKIYQINFVEEKVDGVYYMIRTDWLDKLNLEIPTTYDEYYNVLRAFKEQDPNGNGIDDEIPLYGRTIGSVTRMLQAFGGGYEFYIDKDTRKVHWGVLEEPYKVGTMEFARLYREGLMDKEIFTRGNNAHAELLLKNLGGATLEYPGRIIEYNEIAKEHGIEGFRIEGMPPLKDPNGKVWHGIAGKNRTYNTRGWTITKTNPDPVATIKYMDFWFTKEGETLGNWGIEGVHHVVEDGQYVFTDIVLNNPDRTPIKYLAYVLGAGEPWPHVRPAELSLAWMDPLAKQACEMYMNVERGNNWVYSSSNPNVFKYTAEETELVAQTWTAVDTYFKEMRQKWIMGAEPLNDATFEAFLKNMEKLGAYKLIEVIQNSYDRNPDIYIYE